MNEGSTEKTDDAASPEDEQIYFCYSATLRICGVITDFDAVTRTLGLEPTNFHRVGERRGPRSMPYEHDQWSYRAPVPSERPLHVHIDTLWSHIQPHRDYLLSLKERLTVDVFCGYRSNSCTAGVEVPHTSLELFHALQIPFGLSIIIT